MAKFESAFAEISSKIDYSYCNEAIDHIVRSNSPNAILLWRIIDECLEQGIDTARNPQVRILVKNHYRVTIWNRLQGDKIHNWRIANLLFRMAYYLGVDSIWTVVNTSANNVLHSAGVKLRSRDMIECINEVESRILSDVLLLELKKNFMIKIEKKYLGKLEYIQMVRAICKNNQTRNSETSMTGSR
jgi:hypothetical protein